MSQNNLLRLLVKGNAARLAELLESFNDLSEELNSHVAKINELESKIKDPVIPKDGKDGKSAYDIWVESNGGTLSDYLASMKAKEPVSIKDAYIEGGLLKVELTNGDVLEAGGLLDDDILARIDKLEKRRTYGGGGGNAKKLLQDLNENDVTPLNQSFTYNVDGTLATQTKGDLVNVFSYNVDGSLASVINSEVSKTFGYDGQGNLTSITIG